MQTPTLERGGQPGSRGPRAQRCLWGRQLWEGTGLPGLGGGGDKAEGTPSCLLLLSGQGSVAGSGQIWGESCSSKKACSQTLGGTS